ncbi:MAG: hypothetical protein KHW91_11595 [Clostridiales bacterium]|nr:hypothetical protein [Clostridiales bacterium]
MTLWLRNITFFDFALLSSFSAAQLFNLFLFHPELICNLAICVSLLLRSAAILVHVCIVWTRNDPPVVVLISSMLLNMVSQGVGLLIGSDHRQMHTADTLLKPLKQDAVHRCIYMAYLKNGAYTSAVEQIIAFAEAHALQEEGTQPRSGFAWRIAKQPHTP